LRIIVHESFMGRLPPISRYGKLLNMTDDLLLLVFAAGALAGGYRIWQISLDAREAANRIAKDTCSRAVVQFLDGTVAFAGFRWTRNAAGKRRVLRTYTFDYTSDGFERAQGFIVLAGLRLEAVGLAGSPS
jgi:TRAP-type C4-dicarboxylate transport system permease small subunit